MTRCYRFRLAALLAALFWNFALDGGAAAQQAGSPEAILHGSLRPAEDAPALPVVRCVPAQAKIQLDGVLDEPFWKQATESETIPALLRRSSGRRALAKTKLRFAFGDNAVHVAAQSEWLEPASDREEERRRDADAIGLMFDTEGRRGSHIVLAVNAKGDACESRAEVSPSGARSLSGTTGLEWRHAVQRGDRGWTAEISIPFATLRLPKGADGAMIAMNARRNAVSPRETSLWSAPTQAVSPVLFGLLVVGAPAPRVRLRRLEQFGSVESRVRMSVWNPSHYSQRVAVEAAARWEGGTETVTEVFSVEAGAEREVSLPLIQRARVADFALVARNERTGDALFKHEVRFERGSITAYLAQPSCRWGTAVLPLLIDVPQTPESGLRWLRVSIENTANGTALALSSFRLGSSGLFQADLLPGALPPGEYAVRCALLNSRGEEETTSRCVLNVSPLRD